MGRLPSARSEQFDPLVSLSSSPQVPVRKLLLLVLLCTLPALSACTSAHAGEPNARGCIYVADGGTENNATTGYGYAPIGNQAFAIGAPALITLQCGANPCVVSVKSSTTDAGIGLYLAAREKITSSTGATAAITARRDGGALYVGGLVTVAQPAGVASSVVCVFDRDGNE